jgi:hypothetical protein
MTAKFEAFKAALHALCIEHNVRLHGGNDYDDYGGYVDAGSAESSAGLELELSDCIPLTPEEQAQEDERRSKAQAAWTAELAERRAAEAARYEAALNSKDYIALRAAIEAHAKETRSKQLRVSTDPNDPAYIDDRPRKVWLNDKEVAGWIVADEFRRCVIVRGVEYQCIEEETPRRAPDVVLHGAVLIERLPDDAADPVTEVAPESNSHLCGIFVSDKPAAPVEEPAAEPVAATYAPPGVVEVTPASVFTAPLKGNIEVRPAAVERSVKRKKSRR